MFSLKAFAVIQLIFQLCIGQNCVYEDANTGYKLYLDALEHATLTFTDDQRIDEHTYTYTPCRNGAGECSTDSGTNTAMCRQTLSTDDTVCVVIANVDSSVVPSFNTDSNPNGTWEFQFNNGDECNSVPRSFNVYLDCDLEAGDYQITEAGESSQCTYGFRIRTKWACPFQKPPYGGESDGISAGTVFCIILASVVFAYFVFGWCLCAVLNRKDRGFGDVTGNIPHVTFWTKLPALTFAGCCFTKDFVLALFNKDGNETGNEDTPGSNGG